MKRYTIVCLIVFIGIVYQSAVVAGSWVDSWATSYNSSEPGFYEGSNRGYVSFGSLSARWPVQTEYPITVTPPRINAGCGGIDAYWGGFSYISDPEWLVKKAEGMLKNAAFISFDLAIKNMCEPCSAAMATAEQMANFLNGININECALAKKVVVQRGPDDPSMWEDMTNEITQGRSLLPASGVAKNPTDYSSQRQSSGGKGVLNLQGAVADCPQAFKDIYTGGSVMENIAAKTGLTPQFEVLRAFTGDVEVVYDGASDLYTFQTFEACPQNQAIDLDAFVYGMVQKRQATNDQCVADAGNSMIQIVKTNLQNIADSYRDPSTYSVSPASEIMMNTVPFPVANSLKTAVMRGSDTVAVNILAEPIAFLLAGEAIQDVFERTDSLVRFGMQAYSLKGVKVGGNPENCKRDLVAPATEFMRVLRDKMWEMRKQSKRQIMAKLNEMAVSAAVARDEEKKYLQAQKELRKTVLTNK